MNFKTESCSQNKIEDLLQALEEARQMQQDWMERGLDFIHLYVEDVEGDWLETWGEDEEYLVSKGGTLTEALVEADVNTLVTSSDGNSEFERYEPHHLQQNHVVPQFLDNQWIPRSLLGKMMKPGLSINDVQKELEQDKQIEFRRSLINSPQLVINRAYLYNESVISEIYLQPGEEREAFKELLNEGVVVPFLFYEDSPVEPPKFTTVAFEAWKQVCQEVRLKCLRLSWGDNNRQEIYDAIARRFHQFAMTASSGDIERYLKDLNLPEQAEEPFKMRLRAMRDKCREIEDNNRLVTREDLYQAFVTVDGTNPAERRYDTNKPFAAEIKQLLDLSYNINLPDALEGFALTPVDSLPRSALQEWKKGKVKKEDFKDADAWLKLLRNSTFERLQRGLYLESLLRDGYLSSLGSLSLQEVRKVRSTNEWMQYMQKMKVLLENPDNFERGAEGVYDSYLKLVGAITQFSRQKRTQEVAVWTPGIEYILEIAGARLTVRWSEQETAYTLNGKISDAVAKGRVAYVEKLRIAGSQLNQADLNTTIELKKGYTEYPAEQWEALKRQISEISSFHQEKSIIENDATLNLPEEE